MTVRSGNSFQHSFHMETTNQLVLQQLPLPNIPGEYSLRATGTGCVYVQVRDSHPAGLAWRMPEEGAVLSSEKGMGYDPFHLHQRKPGEGG